MSEIKKVYWKISEVSKIIDQPQSRIRFWCKAMNMEMKRDAHLNRRFTEDQVSTLAKFKELSETGEYTIKGILKRL